MLDDDKVAWDMVERCVSKELREDQTLLIENVVDWYDQSKIWFSYATESHDNKNLSLAHALMEDSSGSEFLANTNIWTNEDSQVSKGHCTCLKHE